MVSIAEALPDITLPRDLVVENREHTKLSEVRWFTEQPSYDRNGRALNHGFISLSEINRTYSLTDIIDNIISTTPPDVSGISDEHTTKLDGDSVNVLCRSVLKHISDCRSKDFVSHSQQSIKNKSRLISNVSLLYRYHADLEFIAVYIESLRLVGVNVKTDFKIKDRNIKFSEATEVVFEDEFKKVGLDITTPQFSVDGMLVIPKLDSKKASNAATTFGFHNSAMYKGSQPLLNKVVNSIGKTIDFTGINMEALGKFMSAMGKGMIVNSNGPTVVYNYSNNHSLFNMNAASTMNQTNGDSLVTLNKPGDALPKTLTEAVHIARQKFLKFVPALAGLSLAVAMLYGNSTFHDMRVNDTTSEVVKVLHMVNNKLYHVIPRLDPTIEVSTEGVKGIIKMESKDSEKEKPSSALLEKQVQLQKDFYQAIARFDINNADSIKQLDTLSSNVETILNAQKTLGYSDLIVPDDILKNAKQKLSAASHVSISDTLGTH